MLVSLELSSLCYYCSYAEFRVITNLNTKAVNMTALIKHHINDKLFITYEHMQK